MKLFKLGNKGVSLIEVGLGAVILTMGVTAALQYADFIGNSMTENTRGFSLREEHKQVKNLVSSIPANVVRRVSCQYPHPYNNFDAAQNGICVTGKQRGSGNSEGADMPAPTTLQLKKWNDLADKVWAWPNYRPTADGNMNPALDQAYFRDEVRPAMIDAGCLDCHDGNYNPQSMIDAGLENINFRQFAQITFRSGVSRGARRGSGNMSNALASKAMLASKLGHMLLRDNMVVSNLSNAPVETTHTIDFDITDVSYQDSQRKIYEIKDPRGEYKLIQTDGPPGTVACADVPTHCEGPNSFNVRDPAHCNVSCIKYVANDCAKTGCSAVCETERRENLCQVLADTCPGSCSEAEHFLVACTYNPTPLSEGFQWQTVRRCEYEVTQSETNRSTTFTVSSEYSLHDFYDSMSSKGVLK